MSNAPMDNTRAEQLARRSLKQLIRKYNLSGGGDKDALQKKLQEFISENYYTCTEQILAGLGQIYAAGGEMTDNIDAAGGRGTAESAARAIEEYCKESRTGSPI